MAILYQLHCARDSNDRGFDGGECGDLYDRVKLLEECLESPVPVMLMAFSGEYLHHTRQYVDLVPIREWPSGMRIEDCPHLKAVSFGTVNTVLLGDTTYLFYPSREGYANVCENSADVRKRLGLPTRSEVGLPE